MIVKIPSQSNFINFCQVSLLVISKYNLKNIAALLQDNEDHDGNYVYFQRYYLALDIIEFKIFKLAKFKVKRKPPTNFCKLLFLTFVSLYSFTNPIRSKKFNFKNFFLI